MDDTFLRLGSETIDCSGLSINDATSFPFKCYPNPMETSMVISFESEDIHPTHVVLTNVLGNSIQLDFLKQSNSITFERNNLPTGIYIISIYQEHNLLGSTKVVIK